MNFSESEVFSYEKRRFDLFNHRLLATLMDRCGPEPYPLHRYQCGCTVNFLEFVKLQHDRSLRSDDLQLRDLL
jgi:hypothetical protein